MLRFNTVVVLNYSIKMQAFCILTRLTNKVQIDNKNEAE